MSPRESARRKTGCGVQDWAGPHCVGLRSEGIAVSGLLMGSALARTAGALALAALLWLGVVWALV
jgi:hypothetical protein